MSTPFDRQAQCPNCGAPITFKFAGAAAVVCKSCSFVVARSDRNLVAVGKVADLADIPTPFSYGATGRWGNEPFVVDGRVQLDRASAPGAPWQEIFLAFPTSGRWCWLAYAQGRWYSTTEAPVPREHIPPISALRPGQTFSLGSFGTFTVAEVGQRRVVSAEGEMPHVAMPGLPTPYVDFAGPQGAFGTIDYGDGRSIPPHVYLGRQIDVAELKLDSGQPTQAAEVASTALACPNCGGNLPIVTPGTTERVVCKYCGTASDLKQGALAALGPAPPPPVQPYIPLGQEGTLRGNKVICIGFVVRGTTVEGERYRWREYLLYAGPSIGYLWLMEEDDKWQLVRPLSVGDVHIDGGGATYQGQHYSYKQSVYATVDYVVGEFYWKVEINEGVQATEYEGPAGIVSQEEGQGEVNLSLCEPVDGKELRDAFGLAEPPPAPQGGGCGTAIIVVIVIVIILVILLIAFSDCSGGSSSGSSGTSGGPVIVGPSYGGGK